MESHKILFMVSGDVDVLAVHGDEESHEEASERLSTVPGRQFLAQFLEEAFKRPLLTHRDGKGLIECLEIIPRRGI